MKPNDQSKKYRYRVGDKEIEGDVIADHTEPVKKIWDTILPKTYPFVLKFETESVLEVERERRMGPYKHTENKIFYVGKVTLDNQPLIDAGWKGERVTEEFAKKAYGDNYFLELTEKLRHLMRYVGIDRSNFDFEGNIKAEAKDYNS